jgi:FixJ family two-component response regulator
MNSDHPIVFVIDDDQRLREALDSRIGASGLRVATFGHR